MPSEKVTTGQLKQKDIIEVALRIALIAILLILCVRIFLPFALLTLWGMILAVALYPIFISLAKTVGGGQGRSASIITLAGLLFLGVPTVLLGISMAEHITEVYSVFQSEAGIQIAQPSAAVADWPIVGKQVHEAWSSAADNFPVFIQENKDLVKRFMNFTLATTASTFGTLFLFLGAVIVAGIFMAYGESGSQVMQRVASRLTNNERGEKLHKLSVATIRSVVMGVIGVAVIQALLFGLGFMVAGIPAAGVLSLIVLLLGIAQLPALLVSLPVIGWMWGVSDASTTSNIIFTVYLIVAGTSDGFLKPILLGRGVDAPMPIILIGALGGMMAQGLIGLFLGAVFFAIGYQVFMAWLYEFEETDDAKAEIDEPVASE